MTNQRLMLTEGLDSNSAVLDVVEEFVVPQYAFQAKMA
jgi:hypothetical protein